MKPEFPDFELRVRTSYEKQGLMKTLGARLVSVQPGDIEIEMPYSPAVTQQHGFVHAGVVSTLADNASGYAALSLMPPESEVLGIENKINFLAPARGELFRARGKVIRLGRTIAVCSGEVWACEKGRETLVAVMQSTLMRQSERKEVKKL